MNTADILSKRISMCMDIHAKSYRTITLFEALNSMRRGAYANQVENLRRLYRNGNKNYNTKKKRLPVFIFSGRLYDTRHKFDIFGYTSLLVVDIDKPDNIYETKLALTADPYVVSLWTSPSGNGLKALFYLKYDSEYEPADSWIFHEYCAFPHVDNYLRNAYGINIDQTGKDITRLCFVSYDKEIHLKKNFEPFIVPCNLSNNMVQKIRRKYYYGSKNVRNAFKEQQKIAKLLKKASDKDLLDSSVIVTS